MKLTALLWLIVLPVIVAELELSRYKPPPCNDSNIKQLLPTIKESRAIQHIQISIVKQTTMHVNQKSISRQIITQKKAFFASCAHASKNTAQSWDASPKLTKYRSETTPQAVHVYVHPVTSESQPPLPPGSSRDFQPTKHRMPYSTFKYPLASKQPCM